MGTEDTIQLVATQGRLRREYLCNEETNAPLLVLKGKNKGDFSFDGHRLSSLYRQKSLDQARLTKRYRAPSLLQKYSFQTQTNAQT